MVIQGDGVGFAVWVCSGPKPSTSGVDGRRRNGEGAGGNRSGRQSGRQGESRGPTSSGPASQSPAPSPAAGNGRGSANGVGRRHPGLRRRPVRGLDGVYLSYHTVRTRSRSSSTSRNAPRRTGSLPPVLFVPRGPHSPWLFEEYWMPYFARRGFAAYTFDDRNMSNGATSDGAPSLEQLCEQVEKVSKSLPSPPVIIGHGAGGYIAQECLRRRRVDYPAAVLSCSVPPSGMIPLLIRQILRSPVKAVKKACHLLGGTFNDSPEKLRAAFFSNDLSERSVKEFLRRSRRTWGRGNRSSRVGFAAPSLRFDHEVRNDYLGRVLVLGAQQDFWIDAEALFETVRWWGGVSARPVILPFAPHYFMLDQNWKKGANTVIDWLQQVVAADDLMGLLPKGEEVEGLADMGL